MRIGIYFEADKSVGGVYQYSITLLKALSQFKNHQYVIFSITKDLPKIFFKRKNFKVLDLSSQKRVQFIKFRNFVSNFTAKFVPCFFKTIYFFKFFDLFIYIDRAINFSVIKIIQKEKLDLIFYPSSSNLSYLINIPAIVNIHDLHHRLHSEFKETSAGGRWEIREYNYKNICRYAYRILTESEAGMEDILNCYSVDKDKVIVLKMLPPFYLNPNISSSRVKVIMDNFGIKDKYFFYPAKFWPHKNHENIIHALAILRKKGLRPLMIFSGGKETEFSTFNTIMSLAEKLNVKDQVKYIGYLDSEEISAFYKNSVALIMPTYLGATNIPVLEAWKMKTAVLYSNIRGCREQLGDGGLLLDVDKPEQIAAQMKKIYLNSNLRQELIDKGTKMLNLWTEKDYAKKVKEIIIEFREAQK